MKNNNDNGPGVMVLQLYFWMDGSTRHLVNLICHGVALLEGSHAAASYNSL